MMLGQALIQGKTIMDFGCTEVDLPKTLELSEASMPYRTSVPPAPSVPFPDLEDTKNAPL